MNDTKEIIYRHELKHYISYQDSIVLLSRLKAVCKLDEHVNEDGQYHIRSLYFDTPSDRALREKIDGVSEREKFRIRCYNFDYDFIRLEKKVKRGGVGYKLSECLTKEEVKKIIDGEYEWMRLSKKALLVELYEKMKFEGLRPKVIVDYKRYPFLYSAGNVRITLDYDIKSGLSNIDFFNKEVTTVSVNPETVILEVKYDNFLPDIIRDILQLGNRGQTAFSKYEQCRKYI